MLIKCLLCTRLSALSCVSQLRDICQALCSVLLGELEISTHYHLMPQPCKVASVIIICRWENQSWKQQVVHNWVGTQVSLTPLLGGSFTALQVLIIMYLLCVHSLYQKCKQRYSLSSYRVVGPVLSALCQRHTI